MRSTAIFVIAFAAGVAVGMRELPAAVILAALAVALTVRQSRKGASQ